MKYPVELVVLNEYNEPNEPGAVVEIMLYEVFGTTEINDPTPPSGIIRTCVIPAGAVQVVSLVNLWLVVSLMS